MAFDLYFNISRTAVEILALGLIIGVTVYVAKDLLDEEERKSESNSVNG